jgi:hypothetical protein
MGKQKNVVYEESYLVSNGVSVQVQAFQTYDSKPLPITQPCID